jgi:hypothetical protein
MPNGEVLKNLKRGCPTSSSVNSWMALSMLLPRRETLFALYLTPVSTRP